MAPANILFLIILSCPLCALFVSNGKVKSFLPCSTNVSAEFYVTESQLRVRICACRELDDASFAVAQSNYMCDYPISRLRVDLNEASGRNCVVSQPIDFDPFRYNERLVLCSSRKESWGTPVYLKPASRYDVINNTV